MDSTYQYYKTEFNQSVSIETTKEEAAKLELSGDIKEKMNALQEYGDKMEARRKESAANNLLANQSASTNKIDSVSVKSSDELKYEVVKRILEMLQGVKARKLRPIDIGRSMEDSLELSNNGINLRSNQVAIGSIGASNVWTRTTIQSSFYEEKEVSAFNSTGVVKTDDGRMIHFGIKLEMSRSFTEKYDSFSQADYVVCDPLVINMNTDSAVVTDQKFLFDLDADGEKESISFVGEGSGFLALDKNQDGTINDGNELFGTKSQDGFADLAAYDEDQNGWIDEADSVFSDLKVWTKDEQGNDHLIDLKKAGVGAIYLGNANTQFSLNNATNQTNGYVRKTGVYLKESGEAATIQHIDLVV